MVTRKNAKDLTSAEKSAFVNAVKALKANGRYDVYVLSHANAVMSEIHSCPGFLTWHRQFLADLEKELQQVSGDPNIAIPYWNWAEDQATGSPQNGPTWANDLMGGNGDQADNGIVKSGPFQQGQWTVVNMRGNPAGPLVRSFGVNVGSLGTQAQVDACLAITEYDSSPWNRNARNSFRNMLEGWVSTRFEPELHNRGHVWVGGSMLPMTSPNDPVFFMHHCYIDYIFALWQRNNPSAQYQPQAGGPPKQNWNDFMAATPSGANHRNSDTWDIAALDYTYDTFGGGTGGGSGGGTGGGSGGGTGGGSGGGTGGGSGGGTGGGSGGGTGGGSGGGTGGGSGGGTGGGSGGGTGGGSGGGTGGGSGGGTGGGSGGGSNSGCFIATAAFGSTMSPEVDALRFFRDQIALKSRFKAGFNWLFEKYYQFSPPLADKMRSNKFVYVLVKYGIVYPALAFVRLIKKFR